VFHADAEIDADLFGLLDVGFGRATRGAVGHEFATSGRDFAICFVSG
jgi:hypothetical protein